MTTYTYHTAHKMMLGDLHTPVSTYLKVRDLFHKVHLWKAPIITEQKTTVRSSLSIR